MKQRLIHLPPQQLDPNLLHELESKREKTQYRTEEEPTEDIFEDDLKHIGDWDDNKQHTENSI